MPKSLLDLKIDFAFKQLFGREGNEPILIAFLNALLQRSASEEITSIRFMDPHLNKKHPKDKLSIMDILAKTNDGTQINIEIQLANKHDMTQRTLYYWSELFVEQLQESMAYTELKQTITINILNFRHLRQTERYHTTFHLQEGMEHFLLSNLIEIHFIELPKLMVKWKRRELDPYTDRLVRWLLLLEAGEDQEITSILEEIAMEDKQLQQAMHEWERLSIDPEIRIAYVWRRKQMLDELSARKEAERVQKEAERARQELEDTRQEVDNVRKEAEHAREEAEHAHEELKLAQQKEEESKKELAKAKQQLEVAKQEEICKVAKKLLRAGSDISMVQEITGLSLEEIVKMKTEI